MHLKLHQFKHVFFGAQKKRFIHRPVYIESRVCVVKKAVMCSFGVHDNSSKDTSSNTTIG